MMSQPGMHSLSRFSIPKSSPVQRLYTSMISVQVLSKWEVASYDCSHRSVSDSSGCHSKTTAHLGDKHTRGSAIMLGHQDGVNADKLLQHRANGLEGHLQLALGIS